MQKIFQHNKICKLLLNNFMKMKEPASNFNVLALNLKQTCVKIHKPTFSISNRSLLTSTICFAEAEPADNEENTPVSTVDPSKDRSRVISPETSIRYLKSKAYQTTYGDEPIWVKYRRNFKGQFTPKKTRKTCIRKKVISASNPCPICRDEYLVLHHTNVDLLKQFIHPQTGKIYDSRVIHLCQKKLQELEVAVMKARLHGLLTYEVPFRKYDYSEYYPNWKE